MFVVLGNRMRGERTEEAEAYLLKKNAKNRIIPRSRYIYTKDYAKIKHKNDGDSHVNC